jgi:hypothetical protein
LKTWFADVGRTHLVCPGPPKGDPPVSRLGRCRLVGALDGASRKSAGRKGARSPPASAEQPELEVLACGNTREFTVRRQALRVVRGLAPNPDRTSGGSGLRGSNAASQPPATASTRRRRQPARGTGVRETVPMGRQGASEVGVTRSTLLQPAKPARGVSARGRVNAAAATRAARARHRRARRK